MPRRTPQPVPPLAVRQQPGLSETLSGPRHPLWCQGCAEPLNPDDVVSPMFPRRWIECDAWDQPTPVVVVLCARCETREIDRNHRNYHSVPARKAYPGASPICADCPMRDGLRCPLARLNGGPGVWMRQVAGTPVHLNFGGGRGMWTRDYVGHPTACSGHPVHTFTPPET